MKFNIFIIMSLLFIFRAEAQNNTNKKETNFRLEAEIPTQKGKKIFFGQYWKDVTYALDSVLISEQGKANFVLTDKIQPGQYFLYIKPDFQVDMLIGEGETDISMYLDETDLTKNSVSGSKNTKLLWEYLNTIQQSEKKISEIDEVLRATSLSASLREDNETRKKTLEEKQKDYTQSFIKENEKEWAGAFIKGTIPVTIPYPQPKDQKEYLENKRYGRVHFFDNINLADPRFWRTNYLTSYIDSYMQQWVDQNLDSLASAASWLVSKTKDNDFCFKEMLSLLTNQATHSARMGDENIWARLYEDYIMDKNISWIDSTQTLELNRMYEAIKNNRIGMKAHNLVLETIDGKTIQTDSIDANYLLLYFYDPGCGHCQHEIPLINKNIYEKYKDKGLKIAAINLNYNKEAWENFIKQVGISEWINCADPSYKSEYWLNYDTSGIPSSYILNKNKIIIAKKINEENMDKFFGYYFNDK